MLSQPQRGPGRHQQWPQSLQTQRTGVTSVVVWLTIDRLGSMGREDREMQAHVALHPELLEATLARWAPQARIRLVLTTTVAVGQPAQLLKAIVVRLARPVSERILEE